jgi:hypothetical protein
MTELRPEVALADAEINAIFYETDDGKYYKRIRGSGTFKVPALTDKNIVHQIEVDDTAIALPLDGPTNNKINAFTIVNEGEINSIYISTDPAFRAGWLNNSMDGGTEIGPGESLNLPCNSGLRIYAKCETGKSSKASFTQWT